MVMWLFTGERRLSPAEQRRVPEDRHCVACGARLLRLAEREVGDPYHWIPTGYICSSCNAVHLTIR